MSVSVKVIVSGYACVSICVKVKRKKYMNIAATCNLNSLPLVLCRNHTQGNGTEEAQNSKIHSCPKICYGSHYPPPSSVLITTNTKI